MGNGRAEIVVDDDADGGVGAEVVDVPLGVVGVGGVAFVGEGEERVAAFGVRWALSLRDAKEWKCLLVVRAEGGVVHEPLVDSRPVVFVCDVDLLRHSWSWECIVIVEWNGLVERILR